MATFCGLEFGKVRPIQLIDNRNSHSTSSSFHSAGKFKRFEGRHGKYRRPFLILNLADIAKMIESQPNLAPLIRRVRGGYLKIQGTWMPYEVG